VARTAPAVQPEAEDPAKAYPPKFERPDIDGIKVVSDVVFESPLSKYVGRFVPVTGVRVLTLENGEVVHGCADDEFAGTLGQVRQHRRADHGVSLGGRRRTHKSAAEAEAAGDVDAPLVLPAETGSMTMRDFFSVAAQIDEWAVVLENMERQLEAVTEERDQLRIEARAAAKELATIKKRIARAMNLEIVSTPEEN